MARFIKINIICRFGEPQDIISNNGSHFEKEARRIINLYKIVHHKSSPYKPQTNGVVEEANKNVKNSQDGGNIQGLG